MKKTTFARCFCNRIFMPGELILTAGVFADFEGARRTMVRETGTFLPNRARTAQYDAV